LFCFVLIFLLFVALHLIVAMVVWHCSLRALLFAVGVLLSLHGVRAIQFEGPSYHDAHPRHLHARNDEKRGEMGWVHEIRDELMNNIQIGYKLTDSGVSYKLFGDFEGGDRLQKNEEVYVMYKMYLLHAGHHIHSLSHPDNPIKITVGGEIIRAHQHRDGRMRVYQSHRKNTHVVEGFDEAIKLMHYGQRGRFVLPPELGYDMHGHHVYGIPPHAHLELYLEVLPKDYAPPSEKAKQEVQDDEL
jgi:FKBP-type peptidyl-prolyl cis-trans isomerase